MPATDDPVLTLEHVGKSFASGAAKMEVLRDINLIIRRGELLVIVGPSGSGKSTLLNLMGGLDQADTGRVCFHNQDLGQLSERELTQYRRASVGFVFQMYQLVPTLTALENVLVAADLAADPMPPDEALQRVGLIDRAGHFPAQLSGGEQQRVAIARAVVKRPALLLCDEPTGALDCATGQIVLGLLEECNRDSGTSIVMITHNAPIAALADRWIKLGGGRITEEHVNSSRARAEEIVW